MDAHEISEQLARRAEEVARMLLPEGKRRGQEWCVGDIGGAPGESLKVRLSGPKAGVWTDFAAGAQTGGDLLDLYCQVKAVSFLAALDWARAYLGVSGANVRAVAHKTYRRPERPRACRVPQTAVAAYLTQERALSAATIKLFQIGELEAMSFRDGEQTVTSPAIAFPFKVEGELRFLKYLAIKRTAAGKKLTQVERACEPVLFGWQALPESRLVIIGEGEFNAMSWRQYGFPALATPFGAGSGHKHDWVDREWEHLERFSTIYLDFDQDEAGHEAEQELVERLGRHRCRVVGAKPDGHKDANDCLRAGLPVERMQALLDAAPYRTPPELLGFADFRAEILDCFQTARTATGVQLPVTTNAEDVRLRLGECSIWAGYNNHRKTALLAQTALYAAAYQDQRVLFAELEMSAARLGARLARAALASSRPGVAEIDRFLAWATDRFWLYGLLGRLELRKFLRTLDYAVARLGVNFVVVDSLSRFTAYDDYAQQFDAASTLQTYAVQKRIHIAVVHHLRKEHSEDVIPSKMSMRGAIGIADAVDQVFIVWKHVVKARAREKLKTRYEELNREEERALREPDGLLLVDKDRNGRDEPYRIPFYCDAASLTFRAQESDPVTMLALEDGNTAWETAPEF